jgi:hypothetical protein
MLLTAARLEMSTALLLPLPRPAQVLRRGRLQIPTTAPRLRRLPLLPAADRDPLTAKHCGAQCGAVVESVYKKNTAGIHTSG